MNCLIVSGGDKPDKDTIINSAKISDLIIGVDKGCNYLYEYNIKPDYIVGDFDSSNIDVVEKLVEEGALRYTYNCEKDFTDSEEAFELAISKNVNKIVFLGATGRRFDHALGNLGLLLKALKSNVRAEIIDEKNKIMIINKSQYLKKDSNYKYISFQAYDKSINKFSIYDAKYNLNEYTLDVGDSRTISNEFIKEEIRVDFLEGNLLVIYSKD